VDVARPVRGRRAHLVRARPPFRAPACGRLAAVSGRGQPCTSWRRATAFAPSRSYSATGCQHHDDLHPRPQPWPRLGSGAPSTGCSSDGPPPSGVSSSGHWPDIPRRLAVYHGPQGRGVLQGRGALGTRLETRFRRRADTRDCKSGPRLRLRRLGSPGSVFRHRGIRPAGPDPG